MVGAQGLGTLPVIRQGEKKSFVVMEQKGIRGVMIGRGKMKDNVKLSHAISENRESEYLSSDSG